jgi:hypothetical protein
MGLIAAGAGIALAGLLALLAMVVRWIEPGFVLSFLGFAAMFAGTVLMLAGVVRRARRQAPRGK